MDRSANRGGPRGTPAPARRRRGRGPAWPARARLPPSRPESSADASPSFSSFELEPASGPRRQGRHEPIRRGPSRRARRSRRLLRISRLFVRAAVRLPRIAGRRRWVTATADDRRDRSPDRIGGRPRRDERGRDAAGPDAGDERPALRDARRWPGHRPRRRRAHLPRPGPPGAPGAPAHRGRDPGRPRGRRGHRALRGDLDLRAGQNVVSDGTDTVFTLDAAGRQVRVAPSPWGRSRTR